MLEIVFGVSLAALIYTWLGYPMLVWIWASLEQVKRDRAYMLRRAERRCPSPAAWPRVTVCVAAHNEAGRLRAQLESLRQLDYPAGEVIYVLDGCTDQTAAELTGHPGLEVMVQPRQGKAAALATARERARGEILVFTDAGTRLAPDVLRRLVRHFGDARVGAACGAVRFESPPGAPLLERRYWQWESALRWLEARLGITVTASGALLAVRRNLFPALPVHTLVEDLEIPLRLRAAGYRVVYDPEAIAWDEASNSLASEASRRQRLALGGWRALAGLWRLPLGGRTRWALVSHKILRWLTPGLGLLLLAANLALLSQPAFRRLAEVEMIGLVGAFIFGSCFSAGRGGLAYIWAMNCALVRGAWRTREPERRGIWEQAR